MGNKYAELFQPLTIGKLEIKNRISMPPMGNGFAGRFGPGLPSEKHLHYFEARAKGGFGLIFTDMATVDRDMGLRDANLMVIDNDNAIPGFKKLADVVHKYETKIAVQIMHPGRCAAPEFIGGKMPYAPSAVPDPIENIMPREITVAEIQDLVEKFGQAARRVKEAGFDAVMIHGGHGYMVSQFMSAYANRRTDQYGGNFEGFLRFPLEIVKRVREAVGPDFPIFFRISADEIVATGRRVPESVEMMKRLVDAGVSVADVSVGNSESIHYNIASSNLPMGFNADSALQFKKALNVPVSVTGRINEPEIAVDIIKSGKADIVHLGRQSLADPDWPNKVREGRKNDIVKCLSCNEACIDSLIFQRPQITCIQNMRVGREEQYLNPKASKVKKVLVAGSGPAGMEAARTAALRGHTVILYEKEKELGGQIKLAATPPSKEIYIELAKSRVKALKDLKVDVHSGKALTIDKIKEVKPDVLIIATGSESIVPKIPGVDRKNVISARKALASPKEVGKNVLVIGGGLVGCETADYLSSKGKKITIIEMLDKVAGDIGPSAAFYLMKRLNDKQVKMMTCTTVKSIADDGVMVENAGKQQNLGVFDTIILAVGAKSVNDLEAQAKGLVSEVYSIGDAAKPHKILDAMQSAVELAFKL